MKKYVSGGNIEKMLKENTEITFDDIMSFIKVFDAMNKDGIVQKILSFYGLKQEFVETMKDEISLQNFPMEGMSVEDIISKEAYEKGGMMAKGGRTRFADKVEAISQRLEGTQVPKRLRKDYGKIYDEEESIMAAKRIAGSMKKKYETKAKGGSMDIKFIEYKGKTIMFEPHSKKYFTNDIEFDTLIKAKKYIDSGSPITSSQKDVYARGLM